MPIARTFPLGPLWHTRNGSWRARQQSHFPDFVRGLRKQAFPHWAFVNSSPPSVRRQDGTACLSRGPSLARSTALAVQRGLIRLCTAVDRFQMEFHVARWSPAALAGMESGAAFQAASLAAFGGALLSRPIIQPQSASLAATFRSFETSSLIAAPGSLHSTREHCCFPERASTYSCSAGLQDVRHQCMRTEIPLPARCPTASC